MTKEEMTAMIVDHTCRNGTMFLDGETSMDFIWSLILDGRPQGTCEHCSETFPQVRKDQKFCKRECKRASHNARRKLKDAGKDYEE